MRKHLTLEDPDKNIALWLDLVEKQTGKKFHLAGDLACVVEEIGEYSDAESDQDAVDALCDSYVALLVAELLIQKEMTGTYKILQAVLLPGPSTIEALASAAGKIATYVRKPKTVGRADNALLASCLARGHCIWTVVNWGKEINTVLDELDKRLQQGYAMNDAGSAIKAADQ